MQAGVSVTPLFGDRHAAGLALAQSLAQMLAGDGILPDAVVLGMARGGVEVAAPIARALAAPLDTFIGRKLGVPGLEEVAWGAIAEGGDPPVLDDVHRFIGLPRTVMRTIIARERSEVERRVLRYRDGRPLAALAGRTVIVVDDGLASGATRRAAGISLRRFNPARLVAAVPVASIEGKQSVASTFDEVVCVATPEPFGTVSDWYEEYAPVGDVTVRALLGRPAVGGMADGGMADGGMADDGPEPSDVERLVSIPTNEVGATSVMVCDLGDATEGKPPRGLVVFAHGGGSSRGSYRNRYLAARLRLAGWATLRLDLLGSNERESDATGDMRFDIALITRRLLAATRWCIDTKVAGSGRIVLFGASTGAAAAMRVAAELPTRVSAVMARGGRVDLAWEHLGRVRAPTLLVVGSADPDTWRLSRDSAARLGGPATLRVVPGAGHTFEEPGSLGRVGELVTAFLSRLYYRERIRRWWPPAAAHG